MSESYNLAALRGCGVDSYNGAALKGYGEESYNNAALRGYGEESYNLAALRGCGCDCGGGSYNNAALRGCGRMRLKKGSKEAREFMARLRAMRGKKSRGGKVCRSSAKKLKGGFLFSSLLALGVPAWLAARIGKAGVDAARSTSTSDGDGEANTTDELDILLRGGKFFKYGSTEGRSLCENDNDYAEQRASAKVKNMGKANYDLWLKLNNEFANEYPFTTGTSKRILEKMLGKNYQNRPFYERLRDGDILPLSKEKQKEYGLVPDKENRGYKIAKGRERYSVMEHYKPPTRSTKTRYNLRDNPAREKNDYYGQRGRKYLQQRGLLEEQKEKDESDIVLPPPSKKSRKHDDSDIVYPELPRKKTREDKMREKMEAILRDNPLPKRRKSDRESYVMGDADKKFMEIQRKRSKAEAWLERHLKKK